MSPRCLCHLTISVERKPAVSVRAALCHGQVLHCLLPNTTHLILPALWNADPHPLSDGVVVVARVTLRGQVLYVHVSHVVEYARIHELVRPDQRLGVPAFDRLHFEVVAAEGEDAGEEDFFADFARFSGVADRFEGDGFRA